MIHYNKLGRQNKQILSGLLELCKQRPKQEGFEAVVAQLESTIFDRSNKEQFTQKEMGKNQEEVFDAEEIEFRKMIEEVLNWLNF